MIPLSVPNIAGNEWKYVKDCLDTGWISSVGSYVTKFEQMVADFAGAKYGVAAVNGTAALHIALLLSGVKQDDYVILPNLTFVASANSIKYVGADPLLIDADPDLWQMDLDLLEEFLENETDEKDGRLFYIKDGRYIGAIMPVHILGNMCDMDRFLSIVKKYPLPIVEDSTEALGTTYKGKSAGTFSPLACFSFNGNKIISTGGGGVIVTDDEALAKHAKHISIHYRRYWEQIVVSYKFSIDYLLITFSYPAICLFRYGQMLVYIFPATVQSHPFPLLHC